MKTIKKMLFVAWIQTLIFSVITTTNIEAKAVPVVQNQQEPLSATNLPESSKLSERLATKVKKSSKKQAAKKQKKTNFLGGIFWFWVLFIIFFLIACLVLFIVGLALNILGMWIPALIVLMIPITYGIVQAIERAVYKAKEKKKQKLES